MKIFILSFLLTVSVANANTFEDESCIVSNIQAIYNLTAIDNKIQNLRKIQFDGQSSLVIKKAIEKEEELHDEISSIAYILCE